MAKKAKAETRPSEEMKEIVQDAVKTAVDLGVLTFGDLKKSWKSKHKELLELILVGYGDNSSTIGNIFTQKNKAVVQLTSEMKTVLNAEFYEEHTCHPTHEGWMECILKSKPFWGFQGDKKKLDFVKMAIKNWFQRWIKHVKHAHTVSICFKDSLLNVGVSFWVRLVHNEAVNY